MTKSKGIFLTATIAAMAGALIIIISRQNHNFYDAFTRIVDIPGYWFMILCINNFIMKDGRGY